MTIILETRRLNKKVPLQKEQELPILKDIDLQIEEGEFVSVMGPSGSGKSTLLYQMSGMDRPTSGSVAFRGRKMNRLKEEELARIRLESMGFVFQDIHLLKNLSLIDNIMFPAFTLNKEDKHTVHQKAKKLLQMTGINKLADHMPRQASGGQLQRVGICRALINGPDIIFGDEPTGALDSKSTEEIMSILANIHKQGTMIMLVTHDTKVAAKNRANSFYERWTHRCREKNEQ